MVRIKTIKPSLIDDKTPVCYNVGGNALTFLGGVSNPISKDKADAFMTAFGNVQESGEPAFEILDDKTAPPAPKNKIDK